MYCNVSDSNINGELKCQFQDRYKNFLGNGLIDCGNKKWCLFHLPIKNKDGSDTIKTAQSFFHGNEFTNKIKDVIKFEDEYLKELDLSYVVFPSCFSFSEFLKCIAKHFLYKINLQHCQFFGRDSVSNIKINNPLNFKSAKFYGQIDIVKCNFTDAVFDYSVFHESVRFVGSEFINSSFVGCKFIKEANFEGSFLGVTTPDASIIFDSSIFFKNLTFKNAIFGRKTSFKKVDFKSETNFSSSREEIKGLWGTTNRDFLDIDFTGSKFMDVEFTNRIFLDKTNFSFCLFEKAPKFHGCVLHQYTVFPPPSNFRDISSEGAEQAYRTLYIAMSNFKAKDEKDMFYALLQKSMRKKNRTPINIKVFSFLYEKFSNYGQSIIRPFLCFLSTILISSSLYILLKNTHIDFNSKIDWKIVGDGFDCAIKQILRPFSFYSDPADSFIWQLMQNYPFLFKMIAILESLMAFVFIGLSLFAIRWKFKRD